MSAETLERSVLESKDREQLVTIAQALGIKSVSRAKKADLIGKILEQTGHDPAAESSGGPSRRDQPALFEGASPDAVTSATDSAPSEAAAESSPVAAPAPPVAAEAPARDASPQNAAVQDAPAQGASTQGASAPVAPTVILGPDGEPLAEWELALLAAGVDTDVPALDRSQPGGDADDGDDGQGGEGADGTRRRRRRRRGRGRDGDDRPDQPVAAQVPSQQPAQPSQQPSQQQSPPQRERFERGERPERDNDSSYAADPVEVSGYLDLREEGYGFLRVSGYLPSRDDAYVPVKQSRQYGLRKGDHLVGLVRPAGRNEKNPALLEIHSINGKDPEAAKRRPRFEDLTPLFPDERLKLESPSDITNMTARIIDLVSPIGKGQRGIIVSPPKAGKTTIMKTIATAIERNNPEIKLIVLLIDERPEEVTDMRRTVKGEVIASTFDRPSDEHTHTAELAIERAKRMVEDGQDVVVILDGITRLARAYNLAAPATGRIMSGGIDAGALYPPKKFFGAARNIEEGGSLTILATALVETNSRMDEAIFEEFKGTGNMELRLDRRLAERRIYPAIDVDASSTRHEELLFDRKQLQMVWKLRRVLSGLAAEGNAAPGLELLMDRLKTFRTNDEFLNEIAKQPTM